MPTGGGRRGDAETARATAWHRAAREPSPATVSLAHAAGNQAMSALLAQRSPVPTVQRDVVSDVEDKMSYGTFDWAITDSEATEALNQLAVLPAPGLADAMNRLSQKAKTRLLDNLPSAARATSAYTKVVVAMGPDAVMPYVTSLLSYGLFDWAITDSEAETVFRISMMLPPPQQLQLVNKFDAKLRRRFADNLQREATIGENEQALIRFLFDKTPDAEVDTLKLWMTIRFKVKFGTESGSGEGALDWDGPSLRRMYNVLQALPAGAVEANPSLSNIDRYKNTTGAGGYYSSDGQIALGTKNLTDTDQPGAGFTAVGDPLVGQNIFDEVVRHEVGHSVDAKLGLSKANGGSAAWGAWKEHGGGGGLAASMVAASAGAVAGLSATRKAKVIDVLQEVIDNREPDKINVKLMLLGFWSRIPVATQLAIKSDPAVEALRVCFTKINDPWYNAAGGGVTVGGRIYQEAYESRWVSYDPAARARKVSLYQFRSPGEWFAEAYNAYYAPPTKGSVLAGKDPGMKAWFDVNVDQATGGAGAAAPGPALPPATSGPGFP
jgi:hypothetical protein